MADLKINTLAVDNAAYRIRQINNDIKNGWTQIDSGIRILDNTWDGMAANNAMTKINEIKSRFADARYDVLDDFINFLLQQVDEGYVQTEEANKSLADAFK